jgi:superfamily II DNA or RNA helicase
MYLSKRGYVIKKNTISLDELVNLKSELEAKPLTDSKFNGNFNNNPNFPVYIETKNKIYIPKMYGIQKYGFPNTVLENYEGTQWTNDIEFNGELYSSQIEPVDKLLNACYENNGGILQLFTGGGKSICLLNVLSKLKGKTIIVVNKIPLMNQWKNEIQQFLPNAVIGTIQGQKNIDVENCDIIIAMLQSLSRIDYPDSLFKDISVTVIDEIHHLSSKSFSQVLFKLCSKYTIGLSATPTRADGCEYVFKWHIGDIIYKSTNERLGKPPIIKLLKINSSEYKEINIVNKITGQKTIQFTSMLSELVNMDKRNLLIIELIKDILKKDTNRKILVLSDRRLHLQQLKNSLDQNPNISFTYGLFLGSMKQNELDKTRASQLILATFAAFSEGVSEKKLDTLILVSPKKFIGHIQNKSIKNESGKLEQTVGRIFRQNHIERNPIIIDLFDNFSVYKTQAASRKIFYKQHFKNGIFEESSIDLDKCDDNSVLVNIKTSKKIEKKETNYESSKSILTYCIVD